jgi:hypothetical protein
MAASQVTPTHLIDPIHCTHCEETAYVIRRSPDIKRAGSETWTFACPNGHYISVSEPSKLTSATRVMNDTPKIEPLLLCSDCESEMRLFGMEAVSDVHDLYTFECSECGKLEARSVLVRLPYSSAE